MFVELATGLCRMGKQSYTKLLHGSIVVSVFPAGILQPPFYHKFFPKSLNFGGIGVVIGHEITHGFDDKGRQFDHIGNINQWWDHISSVKFQEKAQCIIGKLNFDHSVSSLGNGIDKLKQDPIRLVENTEVILQN